MPVLDAMARGCPVVLARAGALPETGGAAAAYFDPNQVEDLVAAVGHQFHRDYSVVLRAVLFAVDRHRARQITGVTPEGFR